MSVLKPAEFTVNNIHRPVCRISDALNLMYDGSPAAPSRAELPQDSGLGSFEKLTLNASLELRTCRMTFGEDVTMRSVERDPGISWSFCLGENVEWTTSRPSGQASYILKNGEMLVSGAGEFDSTGCYLGGGDYWGLSLRMDRSFTERLEAAVGAPLPESAPAFGGVFRKETLPNAVRRILLEMAECQYAYDLKRLFLEGKAIEMAAAYAHEMSMRTSAARGLSRTDREALLLAREILDASLLDAPSLRQLSQRVSLNEFKLKRGFKLLFGISVHAYVIERRLEEAYRLLDTGQANVTEAALLAGFGKPSHFAQKFREKYGDAPSRYFRQSRRIKP
ncbi:AraC family transcriptional regulator [Saccharibacillus sacchari]|uniref:AraC family transcriptional regulator n=1 Tax=Saccharibacillus sacchari TaxID=456493 RepID=A0ACC6PC23_9BACL